MTLLFLNLLEGAASAVTSAAAPVAPSANPNSSYMWIMLIAMFAILYFFMIRPQNKKQKEIARFRRELAPNQRVVTAGGIYGVIKEITDTEVVLEIANNIRIHVDKNSIFAAPNQQ